MSSFFPQPVGTGNKYNAVGPSYQPIDLIQQIAFHAEVFEIEKDIGLVQKAHHNPLSMRHRYGGKANVHIFARKLYPNATVLRESFLRYVEPPMIFILLAMEF